MPLQFVKSNQDNDHLVHQGHRYSFEKFGVGIKIWVCVKKRFEKCGGIIHTANNEILSATGHNHTPDIGKIQAKMIHAKIRTAAKTTTDHPQVVIAACTEGISASVAVQLPAVRTMKRNIRKQRQKTLNYQPNPTSLLTLEIPEHYKQTMKNENFLLFDSGLSKERILIFGTIKNLQHMERSPEWFADGTFKVAPDIFNQLYTIHVSRFDKVFPTVFALLPDRSESTYCRMLCALKDLAPNLKPRSITTDFERAAKNAFKTVFPETSQNGCLFHFGQCFWRRIQQLSEVSKNYIDDPEYATKVKCLTALAFVPPTAVHEAFQSLISDEFYSSSSDMEKLVAYVEDNWIGGNRRGKVRPPRFAIEEWNCYQRVIDDLARTNNSVEGWNRAFQSQLGACHPSLWKFIDIVKQQQSLNELQIEQHLAGESPQPSQKKYRDLSERIKTIVKDFENRPSNEYLKAIAYNLSLDV